MAPLLQAVQDEIVVREGEDVGGMAVHPTPPVTAALPLGWRTRRRYDDGDTPSSLEAARTGSFWLATIRSCRSSTRRRGRPRRVPSARERRSTHGDRSVGSAPSGRWSRRAGSKPPASSGVSRPRDCLSIPEAVEFPLQPPDRRENLLQLAPQQCASFNLPDLGDPKAVNLFGASVSTLHSRVCSFLPHTGTCVIGPLRSSPCAVTHRARR